MAESVLNAKAMSVAVHSDPQFRPPRRPRLVPGLVRVPTGKGLLVEGGPRRQSFTGASATTLPTVMDALDGAREVPELAHSLGMTTDYLDQFLALLYTTGLLEDAGTDQPDLLARDTTEQTARQFLTRSLDTTRVHRSYSELRHALDTIPVTVVGTGPWAAALTEALAAEGLAAAASEAGEAVPSPEGEGCALVLITGPQSPAEADRWLAAGWQVLPVRPEADAISVGPLLEPDGTRCPDCAAQPGERTGDADPATVALAVPLVVRNVLAHVGRIGQTRVRSDQVRFDLRNWTTDAFPITFAPDCPRCAQVPVPARAGHEIPVAHAFESSVAFPARRYCDPAGHQMHYKSSNIALQQNAFAWPAAPTVPVADQPPAPGSGACTQDTVTDLIRRTVGRRPDPKGPERHVQRYAPTGGNLGSTQAYLVARDVPGLEPGVYAYQSVDNTLARISWLTGDELGLGATVPATVILTGGLAKVGGKYGAFAWRILHLDAGAATAQLLMLADHHRIGMALAPAWDDAALIEGLAIDDREEVITAVIHLDHAIDKETDR